MESEIKYKYARFYSDREDGRAGEQLAEFLNENPCVEVVSVQFVNTETYNPNSHSYSKSEYVHLIYKVEECFPIRERDLEL